MEDQEPEDEEDKQIAESDGFDFSLKLFQSVML